MKKLRNFFITLGIMTALVPAFLFQFQKAYYGAKFSLMTSSITCILFAAAAFSHFVGCKKNGQDTSSSGLIAIGFICLLIYINFFLFK